MHPELRLYMEVAERLGCTLHEFFDRMPSDEVPYWAVLYEIRAKELKDKEDEIRKGTP